MIKIFWLIYSFIRKLIYGKDKFLIQQKDFNEVGKKAQELLRPNVTSRNRETGVMLARNWFFRNSRGQKIWFRSRALPNAIFQVALKKKLASYPKINYQNGVV